MRRNIRIIYFISSALFDAASIVAPWVKLAGITGDMLYNLGSKEEYFDSLDIAVTKALRRTREMCDTHTEQEILCEMEARETLPRDLNVMVEYSNKYYYQYGTRKDFERVIEKFETNLKFEISKSQLLSQYYSLVAGNDILKKLMDIEKILDIHNYKLDELMGVTNDIRYRVQERERYAHNLLNNIISIVLSTVLCVMINVLFLHCTDRALPIATFISYCVTELVMAVIFFNEREKTKNNLWLILITLFYWIILFGMGLPTEKIFVSTFALLLSRIIIHGIKENYLKK